MASLFNFLGHLPRPPLPFRQILVLALVTGVQSAGPTGWGERFLPQKTGGKTLRMRVSTMDDCDES